MVKQGYKQTEIGVIPEDWEVKELGEVLNIFSGCSFKSSDSTSLGVRWLKIANVGINRIDWKDESYLPEAYVNQFPDYVLQEKDIVLALTRPLLGIRLKIAEIQKSDGTILLNQRVGKLITEQNIKYVYYLFQDNKFISDLSNSMLGTDPPNISVNNVYNFQISLPPLAEQEAIAAALSDTDAWIESLEQLIAKKRLIKQGAMQSLLNPKENWVMTTIYEVADKKRDLFNDGDWIESEHIINDGIRLVQTGNIGVGKFLNKGNRKFISEQSFEYLKCKELKEGDLLICRLAEPAGRACMFPKTEDYKSVTSVDVTIFRPDELKYNREFLMYIFCTNDWFTSIIEKVGGTTHKRISRGNLGNITIKTPSFLEQERIATILSDMDTELEALEKQLAKARQIKQGMMQELLTGRTRLV